MIFYGYNDVTDLLSQRSNLWLGFMKTMQIGALCFVRI